MRKGILSIMLATIFIVGIMATVPLPVNAVAAGKGVVYTDVTSIGGQVDFAFNLTGTAWTGSQVDLILSPNGYATYDPNTDVVVKTQIDLVYDGSYIDGLVGRITLTYDIIDEFVTKNGFESQSNVTAFLKLTDYNNFIATNSFKIILKSSSYVQLNGDRFSYVPSTGFGTTNWFNFTVDLTGLGVDLTSYDETIVYANEASGATSYVVFNTSDNTSEILDLSAGGYSWDSSTIEVNGTIADFPLYISGSEDYNGLAISFFKGSLSVNGIQYNEDNLTGLLAILSDSGVVYGDYSTYTVDAIEVSISGIDYGTPNPSYFKIYPSIEISVDTTISGPTGELNPGDSVTVTGHNYPEGEDVEAICLFYLDGNFVKLLEVNTSGTLTVGSDGTFTHTFTLPEAPYGGREFYVTARTETDARGIPTSLGAIKPYLTMLVADENGDFVDPVSNGVAPGDYILVKGFGFLEGQEVTVYENITNSSIPVLAGTNVANATGQFAFIGRMTVGGADEVNDSMVFHLYTGEGFTSDKDYTVVADGTLAKIYLNPVPVVNETTGTGYIALSNEGPFYPYQAYLNHEDSTIGWAPITIDDVTIYNVELIGFDESISALNVTLKSPTKEYILGEVSLTNGYGGINDFTTPLEAEYGEYNVSTDSVNVNSTTTVTIWNTAAIRNITPPRDTKFDAVLFVAVPGDNVTVKGYGFVGDSDVYIDVYPPSSTVPAATLTAHTSTDGTFAINFTLDNTNGFTSSGIYTLIVHQNTTLAENNTLKIYFAVSPTVTVDAKAGHVHIPGEDSHVFVKFSVAGLEDVPLEILEHFKKEVTVTVYYFNGTGWDKIELHFNDTEFAALPVVGGWSVVDFEVPLDARGEMLIVVDGKAYYEYAPDTVKGEDTVELEPVSVMYDLKQLLDQAHVKLDSISGDIANLKVTIENDILNLQTEMEGFYIDLSQSISDGFGDLSGQISNAVIEIEGKIDEQTLTITAAIDDLNGTLSSLIAQSREMIITEIGDAKGAIILEIGNAKGEIVGDIEDLSSLVNSIADGYKLSDIVARIDGAKTTIVAEIDAQVGNAKTTILDELGTLEATINGVNATIHTHLGDLETSIDNVKSVLSDLINSKAGEIETAVDNAKGEIVTTITDAKGEVIAKITETGNSVTSSITDAITGAKNEVSGKIDTAKGDVNSHVDSKVGDLQTALEDKISDAKKAAEDAGSNAMLFGVTNTVLVVIVLGLLAYSVFMRKK